MSSIGKACTPTNFHQTIKVKNEPGTALFEKWCLAFFFKEPSFIHKDIYIILLACLDIVKVALVTSTLWELSRALPHLKNKVQPVQHLRCCTVCPRALFPTLPSSTSENPSVLAKLCPIYSFASHVPGLALLLKFFSLCGVSFPHLWQ